VTIELRSHEIGLEQVAGKRRIMKVKWMTGKINVFLMSQEI
jgi:hypothetical protein